MPSQNENNVSVVVALRLSHAAKAELQRRARLKGKGLSAYIRALLEDYALGSDHIPAPPKK